jgi:hypothetical protein
VDKNSEVCRRFACSRKQKKNKKKRMELIDSMPILNLRGFPSNFSPTLACLEKSSECCCKHVIERHHWSTWLSRPEANTHPLDLSGNSTRKGYRLVASRSKALGFRVWAIRLETI